MSTPDTLACGLLRALVKYQQYPLEQAIALQGRAARDSISPVRAAWQSLSVNWSQAAQAVADTYNTALVDLSAVVAEAPRGLSEAVLRELVAIEVWPLGIRAGRLWLGMADPGDLMRRQRAAQISGLEVAPVAVAADALMQRLGHAPTLSGDASAALAPDTEGGAAVAAGDRAGVERFLRRHVIQAIERGADSLHIEPHDKRYRIRIRNHDRFESLADLPDAVGQLVADTLQGTAQFDLALSSEHTVSFLVDCLPTAAGHRILMRRVMPLPEQPTLESIGFRAEDAAALRAAIDAPRCALVLVSSASQALRLAALHALAFSLDRSDEHVAIVGGSPLQGLPGCTQVSAADLPDQQVWSLIERVLQHEPTRLVLPAVCERLDETARANLQMWGGDGRQVLAGLPARDHWLASAPAGSVIVQLDATGRQHRWHVCGSGAGAHA